MKLILITLCFIAVAYSTYTHGIAGSFQSVGLVNWRGWGYWSKTSSKWTPLTAPNLGGSTVSSSQIAGTSDGGAIIVGSFTSVNGRQAAGVAYYDVTLDDWFPANEVGLYKVAGGSGNSPGTCRTGGGVQFLARTTPGGPSIKPLVSGNTLVMPLPAPGIAATKETITNPVQANPLNGQSVVTGGTTNPVQQSQIQFHTSVGVGRAIIANGATPDVFYVFGNFEHVGLDVDATHNKDLTAAGFVTFTYDPATKKITPSIIGTAGYKARKTGDVVNTLHPRHCGHSGSSTCDTTSDVMLTPPTTGCSSESPHNNGNAVQQAGVTRGTTGALHFFIQETTSSDVYRWTPGAGKWVNIVVNDGNFNANRAGRAGTGQDIGPLQANALAANIAGNVNIRATGGAIVSNRNTNPSPADFSWMVSEDQSNVWIFRNCYPNTTVFQNQIVGAPAGRFTGYLGGTGFMNSWDDPLDWTGHRSYFGGFRSSTETAIDFVSAFSDTNFPTAKFRNLDFDPNATPRQPARTTTGFKSHLALSATGALSLVDERYPGLQTFQANRYANTNHLGLKRVLSNTAEATDVGAATTSGPRFSTSNRAGTNNDDNGNNKMPWASNYVTIDTIYQDKEGDIYYTASGGEITYDPILHTTPGHTDSTYGQRFKATFGGTWMSLTQAGVWTRPFGGGIDSAPIKFWQQSITPTGGTADSRVYMLTNGATKAWNFAAQSGVALYDDATWSWVDPFAQLRLVSQDSNWYDIASGSGSAEVGGKGTANVVHFEHDSMGATSYIIAGSFSYIGDTHYPSIVKWDGVAPGAGFTHVGSPTSGLYLQQTSTLSKRWIEDIAPTDSNPKVGQGTINVVTNTGNRIFVAGTFDRSTNAITSDNFLRNVATLSSSAATNSWQDVDGGCDGVVNQLIIFNKELYAAGTFSHCGHWSEGGNKNSIARIAEDVPSTAHWQSLGTGIQGDVLSLVLWNGELIAAGSFTSVSQSGYGSIASWSGSAWSYLKTSCNDICIDKRLSLAAATVSTSFLSSQLKGTVRSMIATDRLWAVVDTANIDEAGAALTNSELVYYDGTAWWRVTKAGIITSFVDGKNGALAVNGTSGEVILANAAYSSADMASWSTGGNGNTLNVWPGATGQPHTFPQHTGIQHANGQIIHFAAASVTSASVALIVAIVVMMVF